MSPSARREWVETTTWEEYVAPARVSLREEGVGWNAAASRMPLAMRVSLREEGVG